MPYSRHRIPASLAALFVVGLFAASNADVVTPENAAFVGGPIYVGQGLKHTFVVKNAFGAPYRIANVRAGCTCLRLEGKPETFQPGEDIHVPVRLTGEVAGLRTQTFFVVPEDANLPTLQLTMQVQVLDRLVITPARLSGKSGRRSPTPELELSVSVKGEGGPVRIAGATAGPAVIDCAVVPVEGKPLDYRVTVRAVPTAPAGRHVGSIQLVGRPDAETDERPVLARVPFDVVIEGGPSVRPAALWFAPMRLSDRPRLTRYLTIDLTEGCEYLGASGSSELVHVAETRRDARRVVLAVSLVEQRLSRGRFAGTVDIRWREKDGAPQTVSLEVGGHVVE